MITGRDYKAHHHRTKGQKLGGNEALCSNLEDIVWSKTGLHVTIRITEGEMKVRTDNYTDYILARSVIFGRTSLAISRVTR